MISLKRLALVASCATLSLTSLFAQQKRPAITGISHMCVFASDPAASENFYGHVLGGVKAPDPQSAEGKRFYFSATQFVEVLPLPADHSISRIGCVAFITTDAPALHSYLKAHGTDPGAPVALASDGSHWFSTKDPEGNVVQFVQPGHAPSLAGGKPIGTHVIHVGFLVHDKAAEDRFYKDLLGFKPYWFGAMQPDKVDWISAQVPDGHDWLEYMMVGDGSTTPIAKVDQRELGVLNHFSIGVPNMEQAIQTLYKEDRLSPRHDGPQMGKDGKWQGNLYDPDMTRVELMEFQPVMKPCCSGFTAESPTH